jgi:hypothetical protein
MLELYCQVVKQSCFFEASHPLGLIEIVSQTPGLRVLVQGLAH